MGKTFNVMTETTPIGEWEFNSYQKDQEKRAQQNNVERVFHFRSLQGDANALPKYVKSAIAEAGYKAVIIGGTTYSHSVIGLAKL